MSGMMGWHIDPDAEDESEPADNDDLFITAVLLNLQRITPESDGERTDPQ